MAEERLNMDYKKIISTILPSATSISDLPENSSNNVYRFIDGNRNLFAKIYGSNAVHTDNECMIYEIMPQELFKYTKPLVVKRIVDNYLVAVYEDIGGSALADLLDAQSLDEKTAIVVVQAFIDFVSILNTIPTTGYGYLKGSFHGSHNRYMDYMWEYQRETIKALKLNNSTEEFANLPYELISRYYNVLDSQDHAVVPIDNNFRNIYINKDGVKFIDPGAIVSGPVELAYGEFSAHAFGTKMFDILKYALGFSKEEETKIRIYAILSSLNIMAYLIRNNVDDIITARPFGNNNTFIDNIYAHLRYLKCVG